MSEEAVQKPTAEEVNQRIEELRNRKQKYEAYQNELEETGKNEISTTDADARLMCNNNNNVDVSYNVQTTVDAKHKMIGCLRNKYKIIYIEKSSIRLELIDDFFIRNNLSEENVSSFV